MASSAEVRAARGAPAGEAPPREAATPLVVLYTNWRGETRVRRLRPLVMRFAASPPWHPEPTWLLDAVDEETGEERAFALSGMLREAPTAGDPQEGANG